MAEYAIKCGRIFDGQEMLTDKAVIIRSGIVASVVGNSEVPKQLQTLAYENLTLAPAFIDLQVNGGGGILFNDDPSAAALKKIRDAHEQFGVLHILPTVISADINTIQKAIAAVREFDGKGGVLGLHIEGPFINKERKGIHSGNLVRDCTLKELEDIYRDAGDSVKVLTFAPEAMPSECLDFIKAHRTLPFVGHSNASYQEVMNSFENGSVGVTHLYNAMSGLRNREPGVIGASFLSKNTCAGIIADGIHVDYACVKIAKKLKGSSLFLVSDAMPPVGIGDGDFTIDGNVIHCVNGRCFSKNGTIAGSALNMNQALKNVVLHCGIELEEALRMTAAYQAQLLRMTDKYGYIRPNSAADLVLLNDALDVKGIIRHGKCKLF